jgi:enoyl-CoA hydratase/carnithine racemase
VIAVDVADQVMTITLDRPESLNALTPAMLAELLAVFDRADADDDVRVVIVTGRGRAFCAGADMSAGAESFTRGNDGTGSAIRDGGGVLALRIFASSKPVIGAINGAAVGGGASMTLPMDIRLASTATRFGFVYVRRGIIPDGCASWFLPRIVGVATALEWTLTGRMVGADEAARLGLVRSVHEPDDLLPAAYAIAGEIAARAPAVSVALTRHLMWRMLGAPHPMAAHEVESLGIRARAASADATEGVTAFLQKRDPHFTDRVSDGMPSFFPWWDEAEFGTTLG